MQYSDIVSPQAQGLGNPITSCDQLIATDQRLYLLKQSKNRLAFYISNYCLFLYVICKLICFSPVKFKRTLSASYVTVHTFVQYEFNTFPRIERLSFVISLKYYLLHIKQYQAY